MQTGKVYDNVHHFQHFALSDARQAKEEQGDSLNKSRNKWINLNAVCRTAQATQDLLNIQYVNQSNIEIFSKNIQSKNKWKQRWQ